ncbi:hypothetical protein THF1C08_100079 [Vibrio jasicida]|uniref:TMhelix containing protein n=1 Tax=Vibrio jasicida TaxID=766224 RepID=A0AAU9R028_9VIBR|nr:hypothetical protein THF1C08_100079 [Vibrio jasicida]CAH1603975.1 hypothetical protein THF1A12_90079 [Vibrio jasicida]
MRKGFTTLIIAVIAIAGIALSAKSLNEWKLELECVTQKADELNKIYEGISNNYNNVSDPVLRNRIDKSYNQKRKDLQDLINSSRSERWKICDVDNHIV